jgi:hypothetical protein
LKKNIIPYVLKNALALCGTGIFIGGDWRYLL